METLKNIVKPIANKLLAKQTQPDNKYGEYEAAEGEEEIVVVNWNSEEGQRRLFRSNFNKVFFHLAHVYQPQLNPFYASVACIVTTLNALRLPKGTIPNQEGFDYIAPNEREYHYNLYSQLTLLNEKTNRVKRKTDIAPSLKRTAINNPEDFNPGLNLFQVSHILTIYDAEVNLHYADEEENIGLPTFTEDLKATLNNTQKVFIANFNGETIGLKVEGHYSVIGAYDEASDSALVLDTAAHKNPWYWVPIRHLYTAMHTKLGDNYRGYLIVSDNKK